MSYQIPDGKLYDLSMIKEIAHGNDDFVKKMMQLFIDTMPPAIMDLKTFMNNGQWNDMGAVAHKIKPSIDTMGIELLREDIRAVEKYGKEMTNLEELPQIIQKIDTVINQIIENLKAEIA
jgi:HPt (histidine-containing phosphotransfer) domain-containing protein